MLARSGCLPASGAYAYEMKWDGFRAIVSTEGELRVRSRRGWDMAPYVSFLSALTVRAVLDGELVALERGWIKTKNRAYWRYEMEREGAAKIRRERQFV